MTEPITPAAAPAPAPAAPGTPAAAAAAPAKEPAVTAPAAPVVKAGEEAPLFKETKATPGEGAPPAVTPKVEAPEAEAARAATADWQKAKEEADKADPATKEAKQKAADDLKAKAKGALDAWKKVDADAAGLAEKALEPAAVTQSYEELRKAGLELSDDQFKELDAFGAEKKYSPEQVAALREHQNDLHKKASAQWQETQKAWLQEIQVDPEFGGDRFKESSEGAKRVQERFGSAKLTELLDKGFGNNPEYLRMLMRQYWAGMANDNYVRPVPGEAKKTPRTRAEEDAMLFPTMAKQLSGEVDDTPV